VLVELAVVGAHRGIAGQEAGYRSEVHQVQLRVAALDAAPSPTATFSTCIVAI
jgi:hypothetical protein